MRAPDSRARTWNSGNVTTRLRYISGTTFGPAHRAKGAQEQGSLRR
jgi:hypothetical protein